MSNLVIVAIPEEQDRVWKISSEQVPHLTLLFLGDEANADTQQIVQFVEHAVTMSEHGPFYLDVERRGELGPDNADVVFFSKRSWNLKWIKQFRGQLLKNDAVKTAYDSTEQYEEWTPHLTLGYPDTPAKADPNDEPFGHPLYSVCFDRIAVWDADYAGPDFQLEWPDREFEGDLAIAYSDEQKKALKHYGTKGMQWGKTKSTARVAANVALVTNRRARNTALAIDVGAAAVRKIKGRKTSLEKADAKWAKNAGKTKTYVKFHNQVSDEVNKKLPDFNNDSRWKNKDLTKDPKLEKQYMDEFHNMMYETRHKAVKDVFGMNSPSGREMIVPVHGSDELLRLRVDHGEAKHAADDIEEFVYHIVRDTKGLVTKIEPVADSMAQSGIEAQNLGAAFVEGLVHGDLDPAEQFVLEHYGVKGMHWGQRKAPPAPVAPKASSMVPHGNKRKTKVQVEGGENHPATDDAIKVAQAQAKLAKSGPKALTNQELREVATRIQLEQQVTQMTRSSGSKFVRNLLSNQGKQVANQAVREGVSKGAEKIKR